MEEGAPPRLHLDSDSSLIQTKIREKNMRLEEFLTLPGALGLVQRNDRITIDLYDFFLTPVFAKI